MLYFNKKTFRKEGLYIVHKQKSDCFLRGMRFFGSFYLFMRVHSGAKVARNLFFSKRDADFHMVLLPAGGSFDP